MLRTFLVAAGVLLMFVSSAACAELIFEARPGEHAAHPPLPPTDGELVRTIDSSGGPVKTDVSGKGAVLCTWSILTAVQATTEVCGWKRLPIDATIDAAIADMDKFIIDNMPTPITQGELDERKRRDREGVWGAEADQIASMCELSSEADTHANFASSMRQTDPVALAMSIHDSLSLPREPVMNPCL